MKLNIISNHVSVIITSSLLICCFVVGCLIAFLENYKIDFSILESTDQCWPSVVLDDEGNELFKFYIEKKEPIEINQVSSRVINAFLAAEDWNFFTHHGISIKGIIRSIFINFYNRRKVQGASTITQQLIKLLYLDSRKTFTRKIKEQLYALALERQYTKKQILTAYLNNIYFGNGIYGIGAAAERFFNKSIEQLSIDESALLAGIVRCPGQYNHLLNPPKALKRRNTVLYLMRDLSFITMQEYEEAIKQPLPVLNRNETDNTLFHIKEMIRSQFNEIMPKKELYKGGLTIQTTLNKTMQLVAYKTFNEHCKRLGEEFSMPINGALLSIEVATGGIKAIIGGATIEKSQFNRAIQAKRQMGSIFKPLIYAAALQQGARFNDIMIDEPLTIKDNNKNWQPNNYNLLFNGSITLAYALSHSNNIVAIKTLLKTEFAPVIELAKKVHISGDILPYPSLALGCIDGTLKEAVGMFNIFANHGNYVEPHLIGWVKNRWGKKIWSKDIISEFVIVSTIADQVTNVLKLGLQRVQKQLGYDLLDFEAISKTGTTNESRTCWLLGSTPAITTGIYTGCDDNRSMGNNIYPSRTVFPMWRTFNKKIGCPIKKFKHDISLSFVFVNERTGKPVLSLNLHAIPLLA